MKTIHAFVALTVLLMLIGCSGEQKATGEQVQQPIEPPVEQATEQPIETPSQTESIEQPTAPIETVETPETAVEESAPAEEPEAVLVEETQASPTSSTPERCKDFDVTPEFPDGINFNVATNISVNGKAIINGYDYCPNSVTISEWYCTDGIARVKTMKCPTGSCKEGVCV